MSSIEEISKIIEEITKKEGPTEEHKLIYQSPSESLEPVYFWILDLFNNMTGGNVEKLIDNFTSSPGSGHFSELMGKATRMQEEAMKIMATVNTVIRSIINIIYDLKEFEIRLSHYKASKDKDPQRAEAGLLALKQIWMDSVDIKRGRGGINLLVQDLQFVTLRDAFMVAKSAEDVDKIDLNDRVKRILKPRIAEFFEWVDRSEKELQKRYEIEKTYLKSQVNALKLYSRWAKPYLKAAVELEQKDFGREPALVRAFNTILLELALLGKREVNFQQAVIDKKLPRSFERIKLKKRYYSCILVDFYFRGIPQRVGQHYAFGGRAEVIFRGYALNEDELKMLYKKLDESDISEALKLVSGATEESLDKIKEDVEYFLKEEKKEEKPKSTDPFSALFSIFRKQEAEKKVEEIGNVKSDNYVEKIVRKIAEEEAKKICFNLFDIYKKAHGMASHPEPFW